MDRMDEKTLQEQVQEFTRNFGLLSQEITPCKYPISPSQAHALQVIGKEGKITQQELAVLLNLDKSTVSRVVTQLVEQEWVDRTTNRDNRRQVHLTLSESGRVVLDDVASAALAKYHAIWTRLPLEKRSLVLEMLSLLNTVLGEEPRT